MRKNANFSMVKFANIVRKQNKNVINHLNKFKLHFQFPSLFFFGSFLVGAVRFYYLNFNYFYL